MSGALLGPSYYAVALQTACDAVNSIVDRAQVRQSMMKTIDRLAKEIRATKLFIGPDTKLVVLPEYVLTAYPMGDTISGWAEKAALEMEGPEYEALGKIARDNDIFIAGNAYENDPHFKGIYFQTSFILDPKGDVILRYRRLNSMFAPTPHDVWDKYLDIYGLDGVFPVVETEIGRLAAVASEEILYPEITRSLAMRGAEVIVHSTGEMGNVSETPKAIARKARALENLAYVVSANAAGINGHDLPFSATDGKSSIVDYKGITQVESGWGQTMTAHCSIDLNALRKYRRRPGMGNLLARQRFELFAETYAVGGSQKANSLLAEDGTVSEPDRAHFIETQKAAITGLVEKKII
ncbi:nitrilase-related carbon-nitrogen hydrolase [Temperatibacter marinus]|uniref:Nitrilase-related carbon-nitrogen hydrolase n=1 Tax=Temperatibacter marinus TaxID=1456591 RepID=A0AA52EDK0_9PROT|nr:nitrilase-related carbon-nitrogen hydrolase [Temperatibacter marinus]WND03497.1 nitrilase-related carbon-nitrogen hydrolase [Temperatibacter marinus]